MTTNVIKSLNLTPNKKPNLLDKVVKRRMTFLKQINRQLQYSILCLDSGDSTIKNENGRQVSFWWWLDSTGKYFLSIKYGKEILELDKNKYSIICNDMMVVNKTLGIIKEECIKGKLDSLLEKSSKLIRQKFKR